MITQIKVNAKGKISFEVRRNVQTCTPVLMKTKVGMEEMPYFIAISSHSSTSTFRNMTSAISPTITWRPKSVVVVPQLTTLTVLFD